MCINLFTERSKMELTARGIKETLNDIDEKFCEKINKTIDNIYNEILKVFLPDSIEDKVIKIKDQLGLSQLSRRVADFTKDIINNKDEKKENKDMNDLDIEKETSKIISTIKDSYNLSTGQVNKLEKNKDNIVNKIEQELDKEIKNYVNTFQKNDKYINEWKEFYKSKDFKNMEKIYKKIEKNMKDIVPLEEKIKEVRELENIHLIIKKKGGDFNLTNEELELTKRLL